MGFAAGDFAGAIKDEGNAHADGEMLDNQSLATLCLTDKCGTHVVRGTKCPKCGAVCPANRGSQRWANPHGLDDVWLLRDIGD